MNIAVFQETYTAEDLESAIVKSKKWSPVENGRPSRQTCSVHACHEQFFHIVQHPAAEGCSSVCQHCDATVRATKTLLRRPRPRASEGTVKDPVVRVYRHHRRVGVSMDELAKLAQDRQSWRATKHAIDSSKQCSTLPRSLLAHRSGRKARGAARAQAAGVQVELNGPAATTISIYDHGPGPSVL